MIVSVTPSRTSHEFLLALWNFLCLCCRRLISVLLRNSSSNSSFSSSVTGRSRRTLLPANPLGHFLRSNPNWKRLMCHDDWSCAAQTDSHNECDISSAPLSSDGLERRISGKAPWPRGWIYSQTRSTGSELTANSLASWTNKDRHSPCAITFSPHRRCPPWKKKFGRQPVR